MGNSNHLLKKPEDILQAACMRWFDAKYRTHAPLLFHIPNGGSRHKLEAVKLKLMGVRAGVPDLFFAFPSGTFHGAFFELKAGKNTCTPAQRQMQADLQSQGYRVAVCRELEEFQKTITRYINEGKGK